MLPPEVVHCCATFMSETERLFIKQRGRSNLLPLQHKVLNSLQNQSTYIICNCDINMGPALIERDVYVKRILEHLSDTNTYQKLDINSSNIFTKEISEKISSWLIKYSKDLSTQERKYMSQMSEKEKTTLPHFYMLIKIHKNPFKLRPVTACKSSILYRLGVITQQEKKNGGRNLQITSKSKTHSTKYPKKQNGSSQGNSKGGLQERSGRSRSRSIRNRN